MDAPYVAAPGSAEQRLRDWLAELEPDQSAAIDALFEDAAESDGADNGCAFDVDRNRDAVQRVYEEYARPFGLAVVDDVEGHEPLTY